MKRIGILLLIALLTFGAGCQRTDDSADVVVGPIQLNPAPKNAAWLAQNLPETTLAYIRVPSLWDALFAPSGGALNNALGSDGFQQEVARLQQGLIDNVLPDLPAEARSALELMLTKLRGPIETAVIAPNPQALMANVFVTVRLDGGEETVEQLLAFLEMASEGQVKAMAPLKDGKAMLAGTPVPMFLQFDQATGRLGLFSGTTPTGSELDKLMTGAATTTTALSDFEKTVDDSGLLPAMWINGRAMWALAEASSNMAPIPMDELRASGLDQLEFAWMGFGAKQGKGTMRLHLQMPHTGFRSLLPVVTPGELPAVDLIGTPTAVINFRTPSSGELAAARDWLVSISDDFDVNEVNEFVAKANEIAGFDLADLFDAYGTSTVVIDEAGMRTAGRIRDAAALQRGRAGAEKFTDSRAQARRYGGTDMQYWALPNLQGLLVEHLSEEEAPAPDSTEAKVLDYMTRTKTHLFYLEQGDSEVYASVPQALADYSNSGRRQSLADWAASHQLHWDDTILGFAGQSKHIARKTYYYYVQALLMLGDLVKVEIDPFALPQAADVGLATHGRAGIMLDSTPSALTLRVDYEHTALEPLFVSSTGVLSVVAVTGVLAAVAIPAYQDYVMRAKVSEVLIQLSPVRSWVLQHAAENDGLWPDAEVISEQFPELTEQSIGVYVDPDSNMLTFELFDHPDYELIGAEFYYEYADGEWFCSADYIKESLLPQSCR